MRRRKRNSGRAGRKSEAASKQKIDHGAWNGFLKKYVVDQADGVNRVRYGTVDTGGSRGAGAITLRAWRPLAFSNYSRAEQRAYWINIYNAKTVELILSRFPVQSIRDVNISAGLVLQRPVGGQGLDRRRRKNIPRRHRTSHPAADLEGQPGALRRQLRQHRLSQSSSNCVYGGEHAKRCSTKARASSSTIPEAWGSERRQAQSVEHLCLVQRGFRQHGRFDAALG